MLVVVLLAGSMAGSAQAQTAATSKPTEPRSPLASVGDFILAASNKKKEPEKPAKARSGRSAKSAKLANKPANKPAAETDDERPSAKKTSRSRRHKPEPTAEATAAAAAAEKAAEKSSRKSGAKAHAKVEPKKPDTNEAAAPAEKPQPGMPAGTPSYIHAKPAPIAQAFGSEITKKIFSHAYTPVRQLALGRSAKEIPGYECPNDPAAALTDIVPFPVKPATTSWVESYVVGCKPRTKRNFLVMLDADKPQIAELLPGLTVTDPMLQRDAVTGARTFVEAAKPAGCDKLVFADTRLAEPLTGAGKPWVEVWTFNQCGTMGSVEMTFTPSPDGTKWAAKLIR